MAEEPKHDSDGNVKAAKIYERAKEKIEAVMHSGNVRKVPNILDRAKGKIGAVLRSEKAHHHDHKETHGLRSDVDETTRLGDVKAPNVFERAKEEIEALVQTIHAKKDDDSSDQFEKAESRLEKPESNLEKAENDVKAPKLKERAKEEIEAIVHALHEKSPRHHHTETHGRRDDIDESTPIDEVKAPNICERAKEEIEALAQAVHPKNEPKKESSNFVSSPKSEGGFAATLGRGLENVCAPGKEGGFAASIGRSLEKVCAPRASERD